MAITAKLIQVLMDGGFGGAEMLIIAKAMTRGPDASSMFELHDSLAALGCPAKAASIAMIGLAEKINELGSRELRLMFRDEHSAQKDSNRSRRNMTDAEWRGLRAEIFARDDYTCRYCGSVDDLTCDHITPLLRGGTNDKDNLATACRPCNSSKGAKILEEWQPS